MSKLYLEGTATIAKEPEAREAGDYSLTEARACANERVRGDDGEWTDGYAHWLTLQDWSEEQDMFDGVEQGALVEFRGRVSTQEWVTKDGEPRTTTRVVLESLKLLARKKGKPASKSTSKAAPKGKAKPSSKTRR